MKFFHFFLHNSEKSSTFAVAKVRNNDETFLEHRFECVVCATDGGTGGVVHGRDVVVQGGFWRERSE